MPLPNMATTLNGWEQPLILKRRIQNVVDGLLQPTYEDIHFQGTWQPLSDDRLQFKPDNLRSFSWYWLHVKSSSYNLETADEVVYKGKNYRVMAVKDYSEYGYVEYELCLNYE